MNKSIKNVCCIGAGYVGGPTMAVMANKCPEITINVVDINEDRIKSWNSEVLPIFEPGLKEIVQKCLGVNLFFSSELEKCISNADMIFLSVNTPTKLKGIGAGQVIDTRWVEKSAREIAQYAKTNTIVVEKSTLPVRTAETIQEILSSAKDKKFYVLSNPEFLSEGNAINDLINPDRVLIGGDDVPSMQSLVNIYENWVPKEKIILTNVWSSELSKLTANAFLAQRICSINSISAICETTGADVQEVKLAIGSDHRIGSNFINPGPGFGGSCFRKDILNLVYLCSYFGLNEVAEYWSQIIKINEWQQKRISKLITEKLFGSLADKRIAVLGFAFKANTNDTRESPAIQISLDLLLEGAKLCIYDPKVSFEQIKNDLKLFDDSIYENEVFFADSALEAIKNSDAILILTEWEEFKNIDWDTAYESMRHPSWLFDTRNIVLEKDLQNLGFKVWHLGKS